MLISLLGMKMNLHTGRETRNKPLGLGGGAHPLPAPPSCKRRAWDFPLRMFLTVCLAVCLAVGLAVGLVALFLLRLIHLVVLSVPDPLNVVLDLVNVYLELVVLLPIVDFVLLLLEILILGLVVLDLFLVVFFSSPSDIDITVNV